MKQESKIEKGKKVRLHYTVSIDGKLAESTEGKPALFYEHGKKQILQGMQSQLEGLKEGDEKEFSLAPENAYGPYDDGQVACVEYAELPPREQLKTGMTLQETQPDGSVKVGRIKELQEKGALMDFNHPMAGKTLHYKVKIVSVMSGEAGPDIFPHMKFESEKPEGKE